MHEKETFTIDLDAPLFDKNKDAFFDKMKQAAFLSSVILLALHKVEKNYFFWWHFTLIMFAIVVWTFSSAYFLNLKNTGYVKQMIEPKKNKPSPSSYMLMSCKHFLLESDPLTFASVSSLGYLVGFVSVIAGAFAASNYLTAYMDHPTVYGGLATGCGVVTAAQSQLFIRNNTNLLQNITACLIVLLSIWLAVFYLS